ncbi:hypothetical protein, partial [Vibrio sp. V06_P1A73T115]|uniref:hypothetical protein n=1 Tax=Vibrio sp. V06_P1A73T115 TaxID=1938661 RepID=UPI001C3DA3A9
HYTFKLTIFIIPVLTPKNCLLLLRLGDSWQKFSQLRKILTFFFALESSSFELRVLSVITNNYKL